ncbi:MAG TPA: gas vesicle protein [Pyrinomonadaceae bacterium]|nr:gas vesicle protein [Pyrinomonadaceae bacterium]
MSSERTSLITSRPPGLVDVLDRILDKGLVIAGDIKVSLANVELLTLQIRLLVCSIDKAEQIGLNWWRYDSNLTTRAAAAEAENTELRERVAALERELGQLNAPPSRAAVPSKARGGSKSRPASSPSKRGAGGPPARGRKRPPP